MSGRAELIPGLDVSRETRDRLSDLAELTRKWTRRINLVSPATVSDLWTRHILDSAQLYPRAGGKIGHWVDLGSGGGFPGLVIASLLAEFQPGARLTMVESDVRKCTFLRTANRELGLTARIIAKRIEAVEPQDADVLSARALAPLPDLLAHAHRHLQPGGVALFPKGRRFSEEIRAARAHWRFDLEESGSITDPEAAILKLERIDRV